MMGEPLFIQLVNLDRTEVFTYTIYGPLGCVVRVPFLLLPVVILTSDAFFYGSIVRPVQSRVHMRRTD